MVTEWENRMNLDQISGIVESDQNLVALLDALETEGLDDDDISLIMSDTTRQLYPDERIEVERQTTKTPEGASIGGLSGGLLGLLIGGLTLVGSVVIPGAGLVVAGPIIGALTGGAIGTAAGGLIGALVGAGIPEIEAKSYEDALKKEGNVLVIAHVPHGENRDFHNIFKRFGAKEVNVYHAHA